MELVYATSHDGTLNASKNCKNTKNALITQKKKNKENNNKYSVISTFYPAGLEVIYIDDKLVLLFPSAIRSR